MSDNERDDAMRDDARGDDRRSRSRSRSRSASRSKSRSRSRSPRRPVNNFKTWREVYDKMIDRKDLHEGDIDRDVMDDIEKLSPELSLAAMINFHDSNLRNVRSLSGFLKGIVRRIEKEGPNQTADLTRLPKDVRHALQDHMDRGVLEKNDIDARLISRLSEVSLPVALQAVERFGRADFAGVRSRAGFLMGVIRTVEQDNRRPPPSYGGGGRYDDRRGGDRYDDRRGGDRYDDRRGGDRYDDRRGGDRYDDRRGGDRYDDRRDDRRGDRYDRR